LGFATDLRLGQRDWPAKGRPQRVILVDGKSSAQSTAYRLWMAAHQCGARRLAEGTELMTRARDLVPARRHCAERSQLLVGTEVTGGCLTDITHSPTGIHAVRNIGEPDIAKLV